MTATTRRCALFAAHAGPHAVWEHLRDDAEPRSGRRCTERVERPPQRWRRHVTRRQLTNETTRRAIIALSRAAAARQGYRGRIRFEHDPQDWRGDDIYALVVEVAR